jgi:hypothetical protein
MTLKLIQYSIHFKTTLLFMTKRYHKVQNITTPFEVKEDLRFLLYQC